MVIPASPLNSVSYTVPENVSFSKDFNQFYIQWCQLYKRMAAAINSKDIGIYLGAEIVNGQQYENPRGPGAAPGLPSSTNVNQIYRKVVECGALPNIATTTTAHGIAGIGNNWMFTRIYGVAREPAGAGARPFFIPLPNGDVTYPVGVMVDTTNINIISGVNLSAFTYSLIVLEYFKIA
jgi:hypothetical protein